MPPSASSNRPILSWNAPVNAPFLWPKSSLSSRFSGSAEQLTATNGAFWRLLLKCSARATSSLPVPLSPWMRIVLSVSATLLMRLKTSVIARLVPTMFSKR